MDRFARICLVWIGRGSRWALTAAMATAVPGWLYSDGGGSRAQVVLLPHDRAILLGVDRNHSETCRQQLELREGLPLWAMAVRAARAFVDVTPVPEGVSELPRELGS